MNTSSLNFFLKLIIAIIINQSVLVGQNDAATIVSGNLHLDDSWAPVIYLSHIPTFDEMYHMSNKMIVAETEIDSLGYFKFYLDFLPNKDKLYRLHLVKKDNSPATLIIGGNDENHLFLILNNSSSVKLKSKLSNGPFKNIVFESSSINNALQEISTMVFRQDSIASESSASKRQFIEEQLQEDLITLADTSSNFLVSLYAIYKTKFQSNYEHNSAFYKSYKRKWKIKNDPYYEAFISKLPINNDNNHFLLLIFSAILVSIGFLLGKIKISKQNKLKKLTIQERKVFNLLTESSSNQEIADQLNIGLSTVKSHVTSIYSKLNIKSRKEVVNMK